MVFSSRCHNTLTLTIVTADWSIVMSSSTIIGGTSSPIWRNSVKWCQATKESSTSLYTSHLSTLKDVPYDTSPPPVTPIGRNQWSGARRPRSPPRPVHLPVYIASEYSEECPIWYQPTSKCPHRKKSSVVVSGNQKVLHAQSSSLYKSHLSATQECPLWYWPIHMC
jgi:hypothetical protein